MNANDHSTLSQCSAGAVATFIDNDNQACVSNITLATMNIRDELEAAE